jgi:benzodiazapine receptor
MKSLQPPRYGALILWILTLQILAGLSGAISQPGPWYNTLVRSPLTPPGYVFGIVWPILYLLLAYYGWHLWHVSKSTAVERSIYILQMGFNFAWSPIFFSAQQVLLALSIIGVMILLTLYLLIKGRRLHQRAWLVLIPYILWLLFAFYLTGYIFLFTV